MKKEPPPDKWEQSLKTKELVRILILVEFYNTRPDETTEEALLLKTRLSLPTGDGKSRARLILAELQFLVDKGLVQWRYREISATKLYRITAEGVLLAEREYASFLSAD